MTIVRPSLVNRPLAAEFLGTALLLFVIVGSGIAVERLSPELGLQLLLHAVAVGAGLAALIAFLAPVSGAHFNPSVSLGARVSGVTRSGTETASYVGAQIGGSITGVVMAAVTFGEPAVSVATTVRNGYGRSLAEFIATFVLVLLILGLVRTGRETLVPAAVGAWIAAVILGTASTGFANPAVTVARMFTDSYAGIAPGSAPAFLIAEVLGGLAAAPIAVWLFPRVASVSASDTEPRLEETQ